MSNKAQSIASIAPVRDPLADGLWQFENTFQSLREVKMKDTKHPCSH